MTEFWNDLERGDIFDNPSMGYGPATSISSPQIQNSSATTSISTKAILGERLRNSEKRKLDDFSLGHGMSEAKAPRLEDTHEDIFGLTMRSGANLDRSVSPRVHNSNPGILKQALMETKVNQSHGGISRGGSMNGMRSEYESHQSIDDVSRVMRNSSNMATPPGHRLIRKHNQGGIFPQGGNNSPDNSIYGFHPTNNMGSHGQEYVDPSVFGQNGANPPNQWSNANRGMLTQGRQSATFNGQVPMNNQFTPNHPSMNGHFDMFPEQPSQNWSTSDTSMNLPYGGMPVDSRHHPAPPPYQRGGAGNMRMMGRASLVPNQHMSPMGFVSGGATEYGVGAPASGRNNFMGGTRPGNPGNGFGHVGNEFVRGPGNGVGSPMMSPNGGGGMMPMQTNNGPFLNYENPGMANNTSMTRGSSPNYSNMVQARGGGRMTAMNHPSPIAQQPQQSPKFHQSSPPNMTMGNYASSMNMNGHPGPGVMEHHSSPIPSMVSTDSAHEYYNNSSNGGVQTPQGARGEDPNSRVMQYESLQNEGVNLPSQRPYQAEPNWRTNSSEFRQNFLQRLHNALRDFNDTRLIQLADEAELSAFNHCDTQDAYQMHLAQWLANMFTQLDSEKNNMSMSNACSTMSPSEGTEGKQTPHHQPDTPPPSVKDVLSPESPAILGKSAKPVSLSEKNPLLATLLPGGGSEVDPDDLDLHPNYSTKDDRSLQHDSLSPLMAPQSAESGVTSPDPKAYSPPSSSTMSPNSTIAMTSSSTIGSLASPITTSSNSYSMSNHMSGCGGNGGVGFPIPASDDPKMPSRTGGMSGGRRPSSKGTNGNQLNNPHSVDSGIGIGSPRSVPSNSSPKIQSGTSPSLITSSCEASLDK